ncbi:transglycosylase SLT domain-containing protein [uncultured Sulfitobacter sp.]|uniref:transglycosylase SLT domain-containing protein n=1 Tax=uncultured Sulfitobacter sp. TaxID=191468 RepID=UPI00261B62E7|nr:transglycosylase SLT domain-containing protein [uncultured Sulfitobacter sp.]
MLPQRGLGVALRGALIVVVLGVMTGGSMAQQKIIVVPELELAPGAEVRFEGAMINGVEITVRPPVRNAYVPRTRWQHMEGHTLWTRAAMSALKNHGSPLIEMVPRDIANWCPAYKNNNDLKRRAFWVGYMSALAKHESTYKPWAVGGGGRWYGLLQILPATARGYDCAAGTGEALKSGAANLSCAVRIMAYTVKRDGVIHGRDSKWRGVSADWGPMRNNRKRADMANWLKRQNYCKPVNATRPKARP